MRKKFITGLTTVVSGLLILGLASCAQGGSPTSSGNATSNNNAVVQTATGSLPAPFSQKQVHLALIQQSGGGDYFQQYLNGVKLQSATLNVKLDVYDAQGDNAKQAAQLDQAIATKPDGIIITHGLPATLCPGINKAESQGIKVVIYDVIIQTCSPNTIQTQQSDATIASLVLDQMKSDIGTGANIGYVNVAGIAPLDRRDAVFQQDVKANNWNLEFKTGKYTDSSNSDSVPLIFAALQAHPDIKALYCPYDEFAKACVTALQQAKMTSKVKVYGADISDADIGVMTAAGSPWVATGTTDPNAIGAADTRIMFEALAGQLNTLTVDFPPILVTQQMLKEKNITNMSDLRKAEPTLNIADIASASWIPTIVFQ
jgi:simple sugar transport system substrate-binding protein